MGCKYLLWAVVLGCFSFSCGQGISISPSSVELRSIEGWAVDAKAISIQAPGGWWIRSNAEWVRFLPSSGTGPAAVKVVLHDSALGKTAGNYDAQITFGVTGTDTPSGSIPLTLRVSRPQNARPVYTYLDGPKGCTKSGIYEDEATCVVPNEKPPGTFAPPARGGSYVDANFGARVWVVTNPQSWHSYASPSALNANNQYLLFSQSDQWIVQETFSGKVVRNNAPVGEGSMWDATDPNAIYSIRSPRVERYDVRTNRTNVVVDYSKTATKFASITNGGGGDTSKDNWLSFYAPTEKQVCALDLTAAKTYCTSYENRGPVTLDPSGRGTLISKGVDRGTGKRYVMLIAHPTMGVFSVNEAAGRLDFEYLAPERSDTPGNGNGICEPNEACYKGEHSDTFEDAAGNQFLVGEMEVNAPCSFGINSFRLSRPALLSPEEVGGGGRRLAILQSCGGVDPWVDWHLSCAKRGNYCAVSTTYGGYEAARAPEDKTPIRRTAHLSEIFVIKNNGAEIRRLVEHRSVPFKTEEANGYWSTPRGSISFDGSYVVFTSNFGEPNKQRVAVSETGYGPTTIASVGDAAELRAALAPGTLATLSGVNLTNCTKIPPAGYANTLCDATVEVGGKPAPLLYASASQINFQVPNAVVPGADTIVKVKRGATEFDQSAWIVTGTDMVPTAPAIFNYVLEDGVARAVVQNYDSSTGRVTLNGPESVSSATRQQAGQVGIVYATNLGATDPPVGDGPVSAAVLHPVTAPVGVMVNGVEQEVLYSGLTPGFLGLYQVNYLLRSETPVLGENEDRIWLVAGGRESNHQAISLRRP